MKKLMDLPSLCKQTEDRTPRPDQSWTPTVSRSPFLTLSLAELSSEDVATCTAFEKQLWPLCWRFWLIFLQAENNAKKSWTFHHLHFRSLQNTVLWILFAKLHTYLQSGDMQAEPETSRWSDVSKFHKSAEKSGPCRLLRCGPPAQARNYQSCDKILKVHQMIKANMVKLRHRVIVWH